MAFWGIEVKPGKPFTHLFDRVRGKLHISQATLGISSSTKKSLVQCNIGDKSPVFLCALLPDKTESCHLDLEFEEADEVLFSVIGPRSVHLTGYYVGNSRHSNLNDDTDSYGQDIANTETEESNHRSDEDEYDDSFIDDSDPKVFPHSPVSSDGVVDEEMLDNKKPKDRKGGRKRLKKKYQSVLSDDDSSFLQEKIGNASRNVPGPEREGEDNCPISSLYKCKSTETNVILKAEEKADRVIGETGNKTENNGTCAKTEDDGTPVIESKGKPNVVIDGEPERGRDPQYSSMQPCDEVSPENDPEPKKKKQEHSEGKTLETGSINFSNAFNEDKMQHEEGNAESNSQYLLVRNEQDEKLATDKGSNLTYNFLSNSTELGTGICTKPKKKRKERSEGKTLESDSSRHCSALEEDKTHQDEAVGTTTDHELVRNKNKLKPDTNKGTDLSYNSLLSSAEVGSENGTKWKKRRKEWAEGKSLEVSSANHSNILDEGRQVKQDDAETGKRGMDLPDRIEQDQKPSNDKTIKIDSEQSAGGDQSVEKKIKKKRKSKTLEENVNVDVPMLSTGEKNKTSLESRDKNSDSKLSQTRTFSNGLIIEELEMGKLDGKMAAPGKKVKVHYLGKLRENGKVIDSNIGKAPYKFRLGAKKVIDGWNVGLDGMRVGEKRRLFIPPSMGYGSQGAD
ncbi:peptidyl-prolyl cis-trans isomerase FKBP43-like isoform X2 [Cornus florida]|uniref:peptidyl-prolyl cis-trans isomerase FKBP43-like isoform X2 n=1 Tax=Cornus florida TaxID=4283 RepID=UPI0028996A55|nr:peptidyl-prolyl cis-trans isomerase FKBP43-like isoform X2 [Cornus florida]